MTQKQIVYHYRDEEYVKKNINKFKRNQIHTSMETHADVIGINLEKKHNPKKVIFVHGDFSSKNRNNIFLVYKFLKI